MTGNKLNKDSQPFRVPENYFSETGEKLLVTLTEKQPESRSAGIKRLLKPALMLAAAMIAFAIISYSVLKILFPDDNTLIEQDYTELLYEIDEAELINELSTDYNEDEYQPDPDDIIEYLVDQDIEDLQIIELLN
ncbi:MAG TPA: hypothetical protein VJ877_08810 [Bacteroidales bacterium]|nr:hypothetical protein [Bacteroidales bacterium]